MSFLKKFTDSAKELANGRALIICAILLVVRVLFGIYANFTVALFPLIKIGLEFFPVVVVAYLYGPVCAAIVSGAGDVLSVILANATSFSITPSITACYVLEGVIFGVVLYGCELRFRDIAIAESAVTLLCRIPFDTLALCQVMGLPYWETLFQRALILIPLSALECLIIFAVKKLLYKANQSLKSEPNEQYDT